LRVQKLTVKGHTYYQLREKRNGKDVVLKHLGKDPTLAIAEIERGKRIVQATTQYPDLAIKGGQAALTEYEKRQQGKGNVGQNKYSTIVIDPPWPVEKIVRDVRPNQYEFDYPTMPLDEIREFDVMKRVPAENCHLYLWTINKYIPESYEIAKAWGFKPSCLLTWCKTKHGLGLGGAFTQTTEHLLFCRKGILSVQKRIDTTWFLAERKGHSQKPMMFMDMIVEVSGDLPRIELFSRRKALGWDCWGNEVENDVRLEV